MSEPNEIVTYKVTFLKSKKEWKVSYVMPVGTRPDPLRFATEAEAIAHAEEKTAWFRRQPEFQPGFEPISGVSQHQGRWMAKAMIDGVRTYIGSFSTYVEAIDAIRLKTTKIGYSCHRLPTGMWEVRHNNQPQAVMTFENALKECGFWDITEQE